MGWRPTKSIVFDEISITCEVRKFSKGRTNSRQMDEKFLKHPRPPMGRCSCPQSHHPNFQLLEARPAGFRSPNVIPMQFGCAPKLFVVCARWNSLITAFWIRSNAGKIRTWITQVSNLQPLILTSMSREYSLWPPNNVPMMKWSNLNSPRQNLLELNFVCWIEQSNQAENSFQQDLWTIFSPAFPSYSCVFPCQQILIPTSTMIRNHSVSVHFISLPHNFEA